MVFTNNTANPQVFNTIRDSVSMLAPSQRMRDVLKDKKIVAARRQPPNIKSMLFRPRFDTTIRSSQGSVLQCRNDPLRKKTCGQPCKCCDALIECETITFKGQSEPFALKWQFSCDTMGVIYALTCEGCGENYIGQTERSVRDRCGDYRRAITTCSYTQGVQKHLAECGKGLLQMTPFYKVRTFGRGHAMILQHEEFFIKKFSPRLNSLQL